MNFFSYLDTQKQEDRQAFIIHYPAGAGKSRFVQRACQTRAGLYALDLLAQFQLHPELRVREFNPERLERYLLGYVYPVGTHTVLVDNGDFLFNTWTRTDKEAFVQWLSYPLRTPSVTDKTLILIVQTDEVFSSVKMQNSRGGSRILALNEFEAL